MYNPKSISRPAVFILMTAVLISQSLFAKENVKPNLSAHFDSNEIQQAEEAKIQRDGLDGIPLNPAPADDPPMNGLNCSIPYMIYIPQDLPYQQVGAQTCQHNNDYQAADMCYGYGYGGGEDCTYQIEISQRIMLRFYLDPKGTEWSYFEIRTECEPPNGECIARYMNTDGNEYSSGWLYFEPGTYYMHIDTWPDPDCIPDYDLIIAGDYTVPVDCPEGSVVEDEPYGENYNGGCTMEENPTWEPIECNTSFCGKAWADGETRDTDWFEFTLDAVSEVTWSGVAEFDIAMYILLPDPTCQNIYVLDYAFAEHPNDTIVCRTVLDPGTYWLWAGPYMFDPTPEDYRDYTAWLSCEPPNSYCGASGTCDEYISRVQVYGGIDNESSCGQYSDFTNLSAMLNPGGAYPVSIEIANGYSADIGAVWIDWNNDYIFGDDEQVPLDVFIGTGPYTGNIEVPSGVELGSYRMRIRLQYQGSPEPCGETTYGEVEDYTIEIAYVDSYSMIIDPEQMHWADGNLVDPQEVLIYLGMTEPFFTLEDVIIESITVNGLTPNGVTFGTHPMIPGEVMIIAADKASFVGTYGAIWDTEDHDYTVHLESSTSGAWDLVQSVSLVGHVSGDVNTDGVVNIMDIMYLIAFKYKEGPPPRPFESIGDVNADGNIDVLDVIYLVQYKFRGGPAPLHP